MMNKSLAQRAIQGMRSASAVSVAAAARPLCRSVAANHRSFSTALVEKELGEEAAYFRRQEHEAKEKIRAEMDRILALEEGHEEKEELESFIEKKIESKDKGSILTDWKFAVPFGLMATIPAIHNEWLVIDAELQLTCSFLIFLATFYTQVGPIASKAFEARRKEISDDFKKIDDDIKAQIQEAIDNNEQAMTASDDVRTIYEIKDQLAVAEAEVASKAEAHMYREAIVKKLDSLHALEESAASAIRQRMLTSVTDSVVKTFQSDKKAKEDALAAAIKVLSTGKMGDDVVGKVFTSSLKNYSSAYSKTANDDPILKQLEKDMKVVAEAPVVERKGGNVYEISTSM